jgi:hypothetical protein
MVRTLRNEKHREALIERLRALTGDERPRWGRMNADQMMSHLVQAGDLPLEGGQEERSNFFSRMVVKPLILYVLPMPKGVKVAAEFDQQEKGRKPVEFGSDREVVIRQMNTLGTIDASLKCKNHPFFGTMSVEEWSIIAHKHIDHHLRQFGA